MIPKIVIHLRGMGVAVTLTSNGGFQVSHRDPILTDELLDEIKEHKPEIISYLRQRELVSVGRVRARLVEHAARSQDQKLSPGLRAEYLALHQDMRRKWFNRCAVACHSFNMAGCVIVAAGGKPCDGEPTCPRCAQGQSPPRAIPQRMTADELAEVAEAELTRGPR